MKKDSRKYVGLGFVMLSVACMPAITYAQIAPEVVGGSDANIEEVPWQVAILKNDRQWCGGSIISERWILTAAHCLDGTPRKIRAGVTNHTDLNGQDIDVKRQFVHAGWNDTTKNNDIALLELKSSLNLSGKKSKAIPIMTDLLVSTGLQNPGKTALVSGWGNRSTDAGDYPDILQKAKVTIIANDNPNLKYAEGGLTNAMIVAGYLDGFIDTCDGDSGGPMVVRDTTSSVGYRLVGVTSFGIGCAQAGYPGVYARVSNFDDWIKNTMNKSVPTMAISDTIKIEGDTGTRIARFLVTLSYRPRSTISVKYQTADGSAIAGSDYEETHGTLTFSPGQVTKTLSVPLISDNVEEELNESFFMRLSSPVGVIFVDSEGEAKIIDTD